MSAPTGESALIDFDGWLGSQDEDTRGGIQQILSVTPEPERDTRKKRIAAIFAVAEQSQLEPADVQQNWDRVRGGYSEEKGGEWLAAKTDDSKFFGLLQQQATQQRDERYLLQGPEEEKDAEKARAMKESSLLFKAQEAAYTGKSYADALIEWDATAKGKPGYSDGRLSEYADIAAREHKAMADSLAKVRPIATQAFEKIAAARDGGEGDVAPFELLRGLTPEEKHLAFRVMGDMAGGKDKSRTQAFFEAVGRGFERLAVGGGSAALRSRILERRFQAGDVVTEADAGAQVSADFMSESLARQSGGIGSGAGGLARAVYGNSHRRLTEEEAAQWNEQLTGALDDLDTAERLREFGQNVIDPTKGAGGWMFKKLVLPVADSAAIMGTLMIPGAWPAALEMGARSYQNDEYTRLRGIGMEAGEANKLAAVAGTAQAALDKLQLSILARGIPGTKAALQRFAMAGGTAARFGVNFSTTLAAETAIELTQDHVIPALVQDNLASDPAFDVAWGKVWSDAAAATPDIALGMVLLAGMGGIAQTRAQTAAVRELSGSKAAMRMRGYSLEQIEEIQAAPVESRGELLSRYLPTEAPTGAAQTALVEEVATLARQEEESFALKHSAEVVSTAEAADYAIRVVRNASGWQVTKADGGTVTVDTAEAARRIREDLRQAATQEEANALTAIVDSWHAKATDDTARETVLTGETARSDGQSITYTRDGQITREIRNAKDLETLREEARMDASVGGFGDIDVLVNGSNVLEFGPRVANAARQVVQRLEINQSESAALTAIHEQIESTWRTGIERGTISLEETRTAVAAVASALDPAAARDTSERAFRERVQRVAAGTATESETRETVSELAVAEVIGRRKDGKTMPAGSVTAAIDAALLSATDAAEVKALSRFRALLRAARHWFRAVFGTVAAIQKAKRDGKLSEDWEGFMNKLLGLDEQAAYDETLIEEVEYVPPTDEEMEAGIAFSVSSRDRLELISANYAANREKFAEVGTHKSLTLVSDVKAAPEITTILAVTSEGRVVGEASYAFPHSRVPDAIEGAFEVDPEFRRQGVATALYDTAERLSGKKIAPSLPHSMDAGAFWAARDPRYASSASPESRAPSLGASFSLSPAERSEAYQVAADTLYRSTKDTPANKDFGPADRAAVREAYQEIVDQIGFTTVPIADVMEKAGFGLGNQSKGLLMQMYRDGEIVSLPSGDWSLSNERKKAWGVRAAGEIGLLMQMSGRTFRTSASERLELITKRVESALKKNPQRRLEIERRASEKLRKEAIRLETENWTPSGDKIRPLVEQRTSAELDKEQAFRQAARAGELIAAGAEEKQARKTARKEAADWRAEQEEMMKKDWNPRARLVRDLRALDAILSVLPAEIRGKVGGFVKLAQLSTNEARLAEIGRRIEKISGLLEKHLQKEYDQALQDLFKRAKPKKDSAGKKRVGKVGADVHALFATLENATEWTPEEATAYIAGLDAQLASGDLTAEQEAHVIQESALIQLVADWKNADAERRATAVENATTVFQTGYAAFKLLKTQQAEARKARREALRTDAGKKGTKAERDAREAQAQGVTGGISKSILGLSSFERAMSWVFGDTSKEAQRITDMERAASNVKEDEVQEIEQEVADLFERFVTPGNIWQKVKGRALLAEELRWQMAQKTISAGNIKLSELEAITATLMWRQEDGRRHMEGKRDENNQVVSEWSYDQAFIDQIESQLSNEAKAVRSYLIQRYSGEYTALNNVYRELNGIDLPKNSKYSPITVVPQQASSGQTIDPVTGTTSSSGSMTPGALRTRGVAIAEPDFRDALQVFIAHTKQMAHWKAYAPVTTEAQALLGNREVGNSIQAVATDQAVTVLRGWLDYFAQGGTRDAAAHLEINQAFSRMVNRAATIALVGRVGTLAIQSTQLAAATAEMPMGAYLARLGKLMSGQLGWGKALSSPYIQRRVQQMPPIARAAIEGLKAEKPNIARHNAQKLGWLIGGTDGLFTAGTYAMVYDYQLSQGKKLGLTGADLETHARTSAERITDRVAQPTRPGARSLFENTATNPFVRITWAFASEGRKNFGLLAYALAKRPARQKVWAVRSVLLFSTMLAAMIRAAMRDALTGDDDEVFDEKTWDLKRIGLAAAAEPIKGVPVVGSLIEAGLFKIAGEYRPAGNMLSGAERAIGSAKHLDEWIEGERETAEMMKDVDGILSGLGLFHSNIAAAASFSHLAKDLFGAVDNVAGEDE